jgi:flagellar hook-associated protein 1 FlgK
MDQRDLLLQKLAGYADIATSFASDGTVDVTLGGTSGAPLVTGGTAQTLAMTTASDGTITFRRGRWRRHAVGRHARRAAAGTGPRGRCAQSARRSGQTVITTVNTAQGNGTALDGSAGAALLSGTGAGDIALATTNGAAIATAASGAAAGSRDTTNLTALRNALTSADPAGTMDDLLYQVSATVQARTTTRDALKTISDAAKTALLPRRASISTPKPST